MNFMTSFWINQLFLTTILYLSSFLLGIVVEKKGIKVNYTRKTIPFILMFTSSLLAQAFPYTATPITTIIFTCFFLLWMGSMSHAFRSRIAFLNICFKSIDRPEDRPFTLLWFSTQTAVAYVIFLIMHAWLDSYDRSILLQITIIVSGIGDSLAEPVGVRFGKRKYETKALFTDRTYTRSYMGSLCVFSSAVAGIVLLQDYMTVTQFLLALLLMPVCLTLTEAKSPHTWDQPFLMLAGGILTVMIIELSALI
jgi:phytol kinase